MLHEHPRIGSDGESEEVSLASDPDVTSPVKMRQKNRRLSEVCLLIFSFYLFVISCVNLFFLFLFLFFLKIYFSSHCWSSKTLANVCRYQPIFGYRNLSWPNNLAVVPSSTGRWHGPTGDNPSQKSASAAWRPTQNSTNLERSAENIWHSSKNCMHLKCVCVCV